MVAQLKTERINSSLRLPYTLEGQIHVFTTSHRSFFTNVMAEALRIAGQGTPVLVVQFLKGGINQGPENPVRLGQKMDWIRCDLPRCIDTPHLDDIENQSLQSLWLHTQEVVNTGKYSLVVLDELSVAIHLGLIPETEVLQFLSKRPSNIDIIMTGSDMPKSILDLADQVTNVRRSQ
ncbi:P-loop NTPase family protein [Calothrix sp. NIES-3974]|uniref:P-loop NTPase family protein n=1 Tax=Calothrix sp. NIES-3974 TaxID=2005462 RepID=UPI000B5F241D|nr:P-loop NTPase family protein [Calothrix sp. NIES-3974]BAZ04988.1 cob(I)alamin adenosyltransferase [Calothrix sp. NIES-3974]